MLQVTSDYGSRSILGTEGAIVPVSTRIYIGNALGFGGQPAVGNLISAGYSTVLAWSLHVQENGDLTLNDTCLVVNGRYQEARPMGLPGKVPGPENVLYRNFSALLTAMRKAGGDIVGIDFGNEDNVDAVLRGRLA